MSVKNYYLRIIRYFLKYYLCLYLILLYFLIMTIEDYFAKLTTSVNPELLEGIDTIINFDMKGKDAHIVVKDSIISVYEGAANGAEVSIVAKESDLLSVINGDTNPMMAMMMGKLKISNPAAMMKYAKILGLM